MCKKYLFIINACVMNIYSSLMISGQNYSSSFSPEQKDSWVINTSCTTQVKDSQPLNSSYMCLYILRASTSKISLHSLSLQMYLFKHLRIFYPSQRIFCRYLAFHIKLLATLVYQVLSTSHLGLPHQATSYLDWKDWIKLLALSD